jgi:hypothetical protein
MKNNYLDKVVDQIVSETRIDYDKEKLHTPFPNILNKYLLIFGLPSSYFTHHCKEVYGLNDDEVNYVWDEYRNIIKDKIENNGL